MRSSRGGFGADSGSPRRWFAVLSGVVYAEYREPNWNFFGEFEEWDPDKPVPPALTPNPTPANDFEYDLPVVSWLVYHDPYYAGVLMPILLILVPALLVAALFYAWRTSPN